MAMSGVTLDDEVLDIYEKCMRIKSSDSKKEGKKAPLQCMILKLSDDVKTIVIDKTFPQGELCFDELKCMLPEDEGRYILFDMKYETKSGAENNKIIFVTWNPDTGKIKTKMMISASKDAVKKKIEAIAHEVQACDLCDLDHQEICEKLRK